MDSNPWPSFNLGVFVPMLGFKCWDVIKRILKEPGFPRDSNPRRLFSYNHCPAPEACQKSSNRQTYKQTTTCFTEFEATIELFLFLCKFWNPIGEKKLERVKLFLAKKRIKIHRGRNSKKYEMKLKIVARIFCFGNFFPNYFKWLSSQKV